MKDILYYGPTPVEEDCVQLSDPNYMELAKIECQRFIDLLRSKFGPEPKGARLFIKSQPYDFGAYMEVVCQFDTDYPESIQYAYNIDENVPCNWE